MGLLSVIFQILLKKKKHDTFCLSRLRLIHKIDITSVSLTLEYQNHQQSLLTDCYSAHPSFWFRRCGVQPENLYIWQISQSPGNKWWQTCGCWSGGDHTLRITAKNTSQLLSLLFLCVTVLQNKMWPRSETFRILKAHWTGDIQVIC